MRRLLAVTLVVVLAGGLLGGGIWLVTTEVTSLAREVPKYTENIKEPKENSVRINRKGHA